MTELPLPPGSDVFEKALAAAMDDDLPIDYSFLQKPYDAPIDWLDHLAAACSVDLWFDDWPDDRKREMIAQCMGVSTAYPDSPPLAELKGTVEGARCYLEFVDAEIISVLDYPTRFVFGQSSPTYTPINHPPFKTQFLIKVALQKPVNAFIIGMSPLGQAALRTVDLTPINRVKKAMRVAKDPDQKWLVSVSWMRKATFADALPLDGTYSMNAHVPRTNLIGR
eukprot:NODE_19_length_2602_cov_3.720721_g16_i0.p2 GENE.NODE_19_length_2602_cov_3.720721_g16_i0~~NODE_19_length_2602_cov_3.720721_g16_i0.p2  ORF type:complete len:223 (-),score=33.35 NODE_19_length_2602_cov_3.720721_g16_i0:234-902(-)